MKQCPKCNRSYDESQSFCLDDGTPLAALPENDTLVIPRKSPSKLRIRIIIFVIFVASGIVSVGGWLWMGYEGQNRDQVSNAERHEERKKGHPAHTQPILIETPEPTPAATIAEDQTRDKGTPKLTDDVQEENKPLQEELPFRRLVSFFTFELQRCRLKDSLVSCEVKITNEDDDQYFKFSESAGLAIDNFGNQYTGRNIVPEVANVGRERVVMVTKVAVQAKVMIQGVNIKATSLPLLKLEFYCRKCSGGGEELEFRNVPLILGK